MNDCKCKCSDNFKFWVIWLIGTLLLGSIATSRDLTKILKKVESIEQAVNQKNKTP